MQGRKEVFTVTDDRSHNYLSNFRRIVFQPFPLMPAKKNRLISIVVALLFVVVIASRIPNLIYQVSLAESKFNSFLCTTGDDIGYHIPAVNMLHGYGYSDDIILPIEDYQLDLTSYWGIQTKAEYDLNGPVDPQQRSCSFYRPPMMACLLATSYAIFGERPIVARYMIMVMTILIPLLALTFGYFLADWMGLLAGGLAGLLFLRFDPCLLKGFETVLTEIPAAFFLLIFSILFIKYLKEKRFPWLIASGLMLACLYLLRANLIMAGGFFIVYLYLQKIRRRDLLVFGLCVYLPLLTWSTVVSVAKGEYVFFTTQGINSLPESNNIYVLDGIGPDQERAGTWYPHHKEYDSDGNLVRTILTAAGPNEDPLEKTVRFWVDHWKDLPRLLYVKLKAGSWFSHPVGLSNFQVTGFFFLGVNFILMSMAFREGRERRRWKWLSCNNQMCFLWLMTQITGSLLLLLLCRLLPFQIILTIWVLTLLSACVWPYGHRYQLPFRAPSWFSVFLACHFVITAIYIGARYYWPLNTPVLLFAFLGLLLIGYELMKRSWFWSAILLLIVVLAKILRVTV